MTYTPMALQEAREKGYKEGYAAANFHAKQRLAIELFEFLTKTEKEKQSRKP